MNRDEIKECMEQVHISEEMQQEIIHNLHRQMAGGKRRRSMGKMAAMAASFVLLAGILTISVQAAIMSIVRERMENISKEELSGLAEMLRQQPVNSDTFSREYTETEKMREKELWAAYKNGLFPEEEILLVDSVAQAPKDRLSYARDVSCFCLPDREMTDEELLEIIDLQHTMAYAVSQASHTSKTEEEHELQEQEREAQQQELWESVQEAGGIGESEAAEIAKKYLETTLGLSTEGLNLLSTNLLDIKGSDLNAEIDIAYIVTFHDPENFAICFLIIDAVNGSVLSVNGN